NISSNTSIVSGLSGYQGEFLELKRLIDPTKFVEAPRVNNSTDHSQKNVISYYENRIHNLNTQLQNSLKQNEKYKNDLYDLQRKVDLSHNDKIEKLLRQNNQLEAYLEAANNQIQRLIKIYSIKDNQTDVALLQDKIVYLEKHNHDLQLQNSLLSNQINQCIYQKINNQCKPVDMNSGNDSFNNDVERVTSHYEVTIKDLTDDVARIRSSFEDQQNSLDKLTKENSDLLTKYLSLQNSLKEKESTVERLDNSKRDLKMKLAVVLDKEHAHNTTLLYLRKIISGFKIELCTKNQEKEYIEKSVKTVKEQFKVLKNKYSILKEELNKKNKEILQLQFDKQELYMKNNWKTCELERMKQKDIAISKLQEKMALLLKNENDLKLENCQQIKEIESIIQKNMKLQKNLDELQIKYSTMDQRYEKILSENSREMDRITGLLRIKENIILNLEDNLEALKKELPKQHKNLEKKVYLDDNKKQLIENNLKMQKSLRNFITNNCANISLNNENIEDILEYVCKLCQFVDCINVSSQHDDVIYDNQLGHVKALLSKIDSYFQLINKETKAKDDIIFNLKKNRNILKKYVTNHIERLQDKCKNLQDKNEENTHMLLKLLNQGNSTAHNWNEEIKYLQVQLQVKIREQKDKQKKIIKMSDDLMTSGPPSNFVFIVGKNQELLFKFSVVSSDYNNNIIKMETLNEENKQLSAKVNNYENMLSQEKSFNDHLKAEITAEKENILKVCTDKDHLNKKMEKITEKNSYLQKEVQHLNSCLQQKAEELKELQARKEQLESNWSRKDNDMQNIVTALKTQLHLFKNEMDTIRNDKFFLQRLCNDLKIALKAHVNHNKVLKEYVNNLFKEKECSLSILSDFPSPSRYDDGYINRLLQENRAPLEEKPLSDIQECLDTLRKEIVVLQKEIMEKNILDDN
ncbi:leucine-rich repeat-containing protein, partial [Asbolus verrucosus]